MRPTLAGWLLSKFFFGVLPSCPASYMKFNWYPILITHWVLDPSCGPSFHYACALGSPKAASAQMQRSTDAPSQCDQHWVPVSGCGMWIVFSFFCLCHCLVFSGVTFSFCTNDTPTTWKCIAVWNMAMYPLTWWCAPEHATCQCTWNVATCPGMCQCTTEHGNMPWKG